MRRLNRWIQEIKKVFMLTPLTINICKYCLIIWHCPNIFKCKIWRSLHTQRTLLISNTLVQNAILLWKFNDTTFFYARPAFIKYSVNKETFKMMLPVMQWHINYCSIQTWPWLLGGTILSDISEIFKHFIRKVLIMHEHELPLNEHLKVFVTAL